MLILVSSLNDRTDKSCLSELCKRLNIRHLKVSVFTVYLLRGNKCWCLGVTTSMYMFQIKGIVNKSFSSVLVSEQIATYSNM